MLRKVLVGRPRCEGFVEVGRHGYRFAGQGTFGRLLAGEAAITSGRDPGGSRQPSDLPEQRRDHRRANRSPAPILAVAGGFRAGSSARR